MIHFDRRTRSILRFINHRGDKGVSWGLLEKRFGEDDANAYLLESLSVELYTVTKDGTGNWIHFDDKFSQVIDSGFVSFCTPKGRELLERMSFDFWKWIIPTLISIVALVISCISLLYK